MNIRLRFKLIALLIVLSLAGLLVFQGYWLKGLYDTLYKQDGDQYRGSDEDRRL